MKKLIGISLLILVVFISCGEDKLEIPKSNLELIVGSWQSNSATYKTTINGQSIQLDSAETGIALTFTPSYNVYSDFKGVIDSTNLYNIDGDSLYFIKNALAFDTLVIELLDESSLLLTTEFEQGSINGSIFKTQTIVNFNRK